jgi:glycosyltransferase involved in cell wall biosynthesis
VNGSLTARKEQLRVALVAGALGYAGAAKQTLYAARALHEGGVDVRVYTLTRGVRYKPVLESLGIEPCLFGDGKGRLRRLVSLTRELRRFRPHVAQSFSFHTNVYAGLAGWSCGAITIGACRGDLAADMHSAGAFWARWQVRTPSMFVTNSHGSRHQAEALGLAPDALGVLPNGIDLADFDAQQRAAPPREPRTPVAAVVGSLVALKRYDRFLAALASARRSVPGLMGLIVGDGPAMTALEQQARALGLSASAVRFLGHCDDVPAALRGADMLLVCSEHEGFPNVILEGMAARLPVITTPAGDASLVVQDGVTGYVVPFDDVDPMAASMVRLAQTPELRRQLGEAGRHRVEQEYSFDGLFARLCALYRQFARHRDRLDILRLVEG